MINLLLTKIEKMRICHNTSDPIKAKILYILSNTLPLCETIISITEIS